ncbi:MAG TPA: glycerophosphodiester phosphodiesterase family protein [Chitinophaga sp.]|uniref:glycerophosphodiester phosphodiesterase family protein n=1 Tax=Chitinophaga sp. TaxID=1869181 RepID=UPI002C1D786C|nr:glycerophosphodiester phosphodiesterase family protein [Chitinophaga sp.]HVI49525.1 glycerophosphodiester phosphodiesterase family protein [Chitinophaga sp.]
MKNNTALGLMACAIAAACSITACKTSRSVASGNNDLPTFFKVGHRGTRGLMPENTIPAMYKGLETGANTIEFDVHITKDGQVVVYHDASFTPSYTTMPDGKDIPATDRVKYTFYQMNYTDIRPFIIGEKAYPAFPEQQRLRSYAPLLSEMIDAVEAYTEKHNMPAPYYLLEIKSSEKTDGKEQPAPEEYISKLMAVKQLKPLGKRLLIQSFDMRPLQVLHKKYPDIALGFLTGDKKASFDEHLQQLGFTPLFYNPHYEMVTPELIQQCHTKKMRIVPWTINETADMKRIRSLGVDGIITDYPNRLQDAGM